MARSTQSGAGGVIQQNTSTLLPLKTLRSSTSKSGSKRRVAKSKPVQTGKGRRTRRRKVSVVPSVNLKTYKRSCAGKKRATRSKTSKKRATRKTKK